MKLLKTIGIIIIIILLCEGLKFIFSENATVAIIGVLVAIAYSILVSRKLK